jgi:hypothetical protein
MLSSSKSHTKTASFIPTERCNARLDVVLGLEKRREVVGGWNKDDVAIK